MNSKYKLAAVSLAMSCLTLATVALVVPDSFENNLVASAACDHNGNHYTERNATETAYGCKEYWVCCKCHTIFTNSAPTTGTWKDNSRATVTFTDADNDSRKIDKVATSEMKALLTSLGFEEKSIVHNADGTWTVGTYSKSGTNVVVPEGVSTITAGAFKGNKNFWVVIPYSVTSCTGMTSTGASKVTYFFVGDTNETASSLKCDAMYKIQEVGWHYENGVPTPGPNPNN